MKHEGYRKDDMDKGRIARNLAAVENHFHSEALNEVEAALETFTDDIVWEAPAPNGLIVHSAERDLLQKTTGNFLHRCAM